jgi:hypothetical protein
MTMTTMMTKTTTWRPALSQPRSEARPGVVEPAPEWASAIGI